MPTPLRNMRSTSTQAIMRLSVVTALSVLCLSAPVHAAAPSFDCTKATATDEKAICADAKLSKLDVALNDGYTRMVAALGKDTANKVHAPFLRRRHACKANAACILKIGQSELPVLPKTPIAPRCALWSRHRECRLHTIDTQRQGTLPD